MSEASEDTVAPPPPNLLLRALTWDGGEGENWLTTEKEGERVKETEEFANWRAAKCENASREAVACTVLTVDAVCIV